MTIQAKLIFVRASVKKTSSNGKRGKAIAQ